MSGHEIAMAISLLVAPPGTPYPDIPAEEWSGLQTAIHHIAVSWEIMDPREVKFLLTRQEDMNEDLNLLRKRYHDLQDAPRVNDSLRFPTEKSSMTCSRSIGAFGAMST